ncbi:Putative MetA-pathway of phenol degradation [Hymenobacter daecheongensis DSM 21074]|uniref:Putative MetA-pathway of phenol degradation n=1 Tax=Hymenobacter daecheongensis DSM 21074 TaxID=1121955 RepID=A0A1M6EPU1_9BACT|nr:transporter [Hymenobacter daecheongensis]SHI87369.1 Putative MetA-pathway of phenol degradation [Hymenobacter daecheongensis DSM 21074]
MRKTILLGLAVLLSAATRTLAQTETIDYKESPFVRHIRPDRSGQTITTNMLYPGQFQLDADLNHPEPFGPAGALARPVSTGALRIGFFNDIELRVAQSYVAPLPRSGGPASETPVSPGAASGFLPLTLGAKFLASTTQNARSQVVVLAEMTLRNGDQSFQPKVLEPGGRLLVSQVIGQRYRLESNLGFRQRGFRAADTKQGQYLGTLALHGPLGGQFNFFAEGYTTWRQQQTLAPGFTTGVSWRPSPGLRFDLTAGRTFSSSSLATNNIMVGGGLSFRLPLR